MGSTILTRLSNRYYRWQFARAAKAVLATPALTPGKRDFTALSMVHKRDVVAYLLAVKSFAMRASPRRVIVVADPTIDDHDCATLQHHIPFIEIVTAQSLQRRDMPVGGTWERLIKINAMLEESYVVQLDADTITLGPIPEVEDAIDANRSFILATANGQSIQPIGEVAKSSTVSTDERPHIQGLAEAHLDALQPLGDFRYVRGCSGFAGFARHSSSLNRLAEISHTMQKVTSGRWAEWGTEQVTSNLVTASSQDPVLLPHPKYCAANWRDTNPAFLHFIGYVRFRDALYASVATDLIARLNGTPTKGDSLVS